MMRGKALSIIIRPVRSSGFGNRRNNYSFLGGRSFSDKVEPSSSISDEEQQESPPQSEEEQQVKAVFPWRHEEDPLPRWIPGTEEHAALGELLSTVNTPLGNSSVNTLTTAYMFLDLPIWQLLFFGAWKQDLTDSMTWAFTQSITDILSKISNTNKSSTDSEEINFNDTIRNKNDGSKDLDELSSILQEKVLDIYKTSANDSDEIEICLKSKPYEAELLSLYCIPYISRSNVLKEPSLLEFYRDMLGKRAIDRQPDLAKLRKEYMENGRMESTVIAQVMVWCNEIFYVKDSNTGDLIQGKDEGASKNVPHLVRMEMTVKTEKGSSGGFLNSQGNWIITDIDDLVDGNLIV